MNISQFNYIESGLWFVIGLSLALRLAKGGIYHSHAKLLAVSAVTFFVFGISDIIEAGTGAWWRPWWLLLIKAACVLSLIGCLAWYRRINASDV